MTLPCGAKRVSKRQNRPLLLAASAFQRTQSPYSFDLKPHLFIKTQCFALTEEFWIVMHKPSISSLKLFIYAFQIPRVARCGVKLLRAILQVVRYLPFNRYLTIWFCVAVGGVHEKIVFLKNGTQASAVLALMCYNRAVIRTKMTRGWPDSSKRSPGGEI